MELAVEIAADTATAVGTVSETEAESDGTSPSPEIAGTYYHRPPARSRSELRDPGAQLDNMIQQRSETLKGPNFQQQVAAAVAVER